MEGGSRRQRWANNGRTQNKKPPHGSWQRTVPSWEKDFCKAVGSLDWETLLQMKKYARLYDDVIKWDDSAGEEAFRDAKRRYWARINGFSCDIPLPDPDLYIQNIDWNSGINPEVLTDLDSSPVSPELERDPVVIFGDSFVANQGFSDTGWGDVEDFEVPVNNYSENKGDRWGQNWDLGDSCNNNNSNNVLGYGGGNGVGNYTSWGDGWNNDWSWSWGYNDNSYDPHVGNRDSWGDGNVETVDGGRYVSSYGASWVRTNDGCKNNGDKEGRRGSYRGKHDIRAGYRERDSINSCRPDRRHTGIRARENWNREKRVS
ncbi:hypothetical protein OROHE_011548 [Orobanche hederae]